MAIYRLHKKDWERASWISQTSAPKRKWSTQIAETDRSSSNFSSILDLMEEMPPTSDIHRKKRAKAKWDNSSFFEDGRKGLSSELSIVVRRGEELPKSEHAWWKLLPSGAKEFPKLDRSKSLPSDAKEILGLDSSESLPSGVREFLGLNRSKSLPSDAKRFLGLER